ncbi:hypothetical protein ACFVS2_21760 [Brevibacillus sp. NPDC058079]|uniref:hypothetical protein n=1 Tax=Brevibacillus sp. NPDC058079 TaxID=3346330 RepID=UPI0036EC9D23
MIVYQNTDSKWYYYMHHEKKDIRYNSLWHQTSYETKEEAMMEAQKLIDNADLS